MYLFINALVVAFLLGNATAQARPGPFPAWFTTAFKKQGLDRKYALSSFLKPDFIRADFNGDKNPDVAVLIVDRATKKKGILLMHRNTNSYFVFGAGTDFGNGSDNFKWTDTWALYNRKTAYETLFDTESNIIGQREIKLVRSALYVVAYEDGSPSSGAIIYWTGKKYIWIHQGE